MRYYSCDSHFVEAREVFDVLAKPFGDRAPRIVSDIKGKPGDWLVMPNGMKVPVGRLGIAGNALDDPATPALIARGYDGFNPGVLNPSIRLEEQKRDGICGEVMYPSLNMFTWAIQDPEIIKATFESHNDWCVDYCSLAPERLIGIGCLPLPDVDAAIAEMKRAALNGVRGFMIPAHVSPDHPYNHADFDPFWAAAEEMGLPLTMHIFVGTSLDGGLPAHWGAPGGTIKGYTMAHGTIVNTMIDIICGGVTERFPKLKLVMAEFETGWLAHVLQRMDHALYRTPHCAVDYLTMKPSEYFHRNFTITFEDDAYGIRTRHEIGLKNLAWGNDYPHHDSIWPNSVPILDRVMEGVPEAEVEQLCFQNAVDLYNIDVSKLPAAY
ncbi:MAG: amidohydrolase [Pseudomonadales bacterium]|nr:amidohydrolase [Pseudomonadales bacterium]